MGCGGKNVEIKGREAVSALAQVRKLGGGESNTVFFKFQQPSPGYKDE